MTEHSEKMEEIREEFNNQADRINYLIKEFIELNETIYECKKTRYYWQLHLSTLSMNIWTGQVKYVELEKREANLRTAVSEVTKLIVSKEQELKDLIIKRTLYFSKKCDQFRIKGIKYMDNFLHAQEEYSNKNLSKEIKELQDKYNKTYNELPILTKQLTTLETLCGLNNLNCCEEIEEILKIKNLLASIIKSKNDKLLRITLAQDMLVKLENEIKQKKITLNTSQDK